MFLNILLLTVNNFHAINNSLHGILQLNTYFNNLFFFSTRKFSYFKYIIILPSSFIYNEANIFRNQNIYFATILQSLKQSSKKVSSDSTLCLFKLNNIIKSSFFIKLNDDITRYNFSNVYDVEGILKRYIIILHKNRNKMFLNS